VCYNFFVFTKNRSVTIEKTSLIGVSSLRVASYVSSIVLCHNMCERQARGCPCMDHINYINALPIPSSW
jgi:hypothetical protein